MRLQTATVAEVTAFGRFEHCDIISARMSEADDQRLMNWQKAVGQLIIKTLRSCILLTSAEAHLPEAKDAFLSKQLRVK